MNSVAGPRAVFGTKKRNYPGVQARAQAMGNAWTQNAASFTSPPIALQVFLAILAAFIVAQQAVTETKAKGSAMLRNIKGNLLWNAMEAMQKYVQGLADLLGPEASASLISSAGLLVAKIPTHQKAELTATLVGAPGNVLLDANRALILGKAGAGKRAYFNWEWSGDGGTTWTSVAPTPYASTEIPGLTLLRTYSFRVSVTIAKGPAGPWSDAVSLLVH